MTDIDIEAIEKRVRAQCPNPGVSGNSTDDFNRNIMYFDAPTVLALVAEVRRLRAKVAAGERLAEAAKPIALVGGVPQDNDHCHVGITTKEKCGRCSRQQALIDALADYREAGKDGTR